MSIGARLAAAAGAFAVCGFALAQSDHSHMRTPAAQDRRELLTFPPPMRDHMLSNMRDHVETLNAILAALASDDPGEAAKIADARLGLSSAGAASCDPQAAAKGDPMATMMSEHMPEQMRAYGYAMHAAASDFATRAAQARESKDIKPALAALAEVTHNCAACHAAYRLR
jgi:cytochrome c556